MALALVNDLLNDLIKEIENKHEGRVGVIDTHIHLWDVDTTKHNWLLSKDMQPLNKTYDFNQYSALYYANCGMYLKYGLFVETDVDDDNDNEVEIKEITTLCKDNNNNLNGMIIKIDPKLDTNEFVQKVNKYKTNPFIKGLRRVLLGGNLGKEIPKQLISNLQYLAEQKDVLWTFDLCMNINKLHLMETVVKSVPNLIFILDHMGNHHEIGKEQSLLNTWKQNIVKLSKYKNVNIKLSGLTGGQPGLELCRWTFDLERDNIDFVVQHFNNNNIVYGSDWPVSALPFNADEKPLFISKWTMQLYQYLKKQYGQSLCNKVFIDNPIRIYNL